MGFFILSGSSLRTFREWAPSATEALGLVRAHMKMRRPGVRIEDERTHPVSFFQLKDIAKLEARNESVCGPRGER
jgi:hypothetical protein